MGDERLSSLADGLELADLPVEASGVQDLRAGAEGEACRDIVTRAESGERVEVGRLEEDQRPGLIDAREALPAR